MHKSTVPTATELEELDRFYREGGLQAMASPHVHYDDPLCPHSGCNHVMQWIDLKHELHNDPERVYSCWSDPGGRGPGSRAVARELPGLDLLHHVARRSYPRSGGRAPPAATRRLAYGGPDCVIGSIL